MKWKKPFRPNARKMNPSRRRAAVNATFMGKLLNYKLLSIDISYIDIDTFDIDYNASDSHFL
jgi:hypothetical protein